MKQIEPGFKVTQIIPLDLYNQYRRADKEKTKNNLKKNNEEIKEHNEEIELFSTG